MFHGKLIFQKEKEVSYSCSMGDLVSKKIRRLVIPVPKET